jgi:hypothetical protein
MPGKARFRLTMHIEGREALDAADFETILTTEVRGEVSREELTEFVCGCVCSEGVLHEDSMEVACLVGAAMRDGALVAEPAGTLLPLVGRDTSAKMQLAVSHSVAHEGVRVAFGKLCVAVPAGLIRTAVTALRVDSEVGARRYAVTAQLTPALCGAYSECHWQAKGACKAVARAPRAQATARLQPGTLSHRNHRLNCQEAHGRNVQHAARIAVGRQQFAAREVLSRKVALMSTSGRGGAETVHTVFFR